MEQRKTMFLTRMSTRINVNMENTQHLRKTEKQTKIQWKIFIYIRKHAQNRIHSNEIRDIMKREQTRGTMMIRRLALCDDLLGSVFNVIGWDEMTKVGNLCFVKVFSLFFCAYSLWRYTKHTKNLSWKFPSNHVSQRKSHTKRVFHL